MAMVDELADYLTSQGVATSSGIGRDWLPEKPDEYLAIYANPGGPGEKAFGTAGVKFENPNVEVVARAAALESSSAEALAWSAYNALTKIETQSLGSTPYLIVQSLQSPSGQALGPDENQRPRYSFNVAMRKELS